MKGNGEIGGLDLGIKKVGGVAIALRFFFEGRLKGVSSTNGNNVFSILSTKVIVKISFDSILGP